MILTHFEIKTLSSIWSNFHCDFFLFYLENFLFDLEQILFANAFVQFVPFFTRVSTPTTRTTTKLLLGLLSRARGQKHWKYKREGNKSASQSCLSNRHHTKGIFWSRRSYKFPANSKSNSLYLWCHGFRQFSKPQLSAE